jgi:hypothetical protein
VGLNCEEWQSKKRISDKDIQAFHIGVEKFCNDEIEAGRPHLAFLIGLYAWEHKEKQSTELSARLLQKVPDEICHPIIKLVAELHSKTRFDEHT